MQAMINGTDILQVLKDTKEIPMNKGPVTIPITDKQGYEGLSLVYGRINRCIESLNKKIERLTYTKKILDDLLNNPKEWE